jgi:WhiB family redox-sensing transcriptional regulator
VTKKPLSDVDWQDNAACALPQNKKIAKYFFSNVPEEKYAARNICFTCPVRLRCLKWALETKQIHGVWGGKDEGEIRRALSVSHTGQEIRRQRFPNCPGCSGRPSKLKVIVADSPEGGRWKTMKLVSCETCEFTWRSRTSANAVTAYHASKKSGGRKTIPVVELEGPEEEDPQDFLQD